TQPISPLKAAIEDELLNNVVFGAMCNLATVLPRTTGPLARLGAATLAQREYSDLAHDVFVSSRRVRFNEMEYAIDLEDAPEVLAEVQRTMNTCDQRVLFPIEVRAAAADDVPLSTAKGRTTCYIAVHRFHRDDYRALFRHIEPILKAAGGRPHWGKIHTCTHEELLERHPDLPAVAELRAQVDPTGVFRNGEVDRIFGL
ncbi:D-arabinono-1,4-lactone oxidase, partial [Corynebacterium heidelbergense]